MSRQSRIPAEEVTGTIADLMVEQAARSPDALYAIFANRTLTYGQIHEDASRLAKALIAFGIKPGDHVATLMPNVPEWVIAYFGCLYAGAHCVALNARYKTHELEFTIPHSDARLLLTTDAIADHVNFADILREALPSLAGQPDPRALKLDEAPQLRAIALWGDTRLPEFLAIDDLLSIGADVADTAVEDARACARPDDTCAIIYTSGTTSRPKGCELTHRGIQSSWFTFSTVVDLKAEDRIWMPMPFYHTGGIGPMTAVLKHGAAFMTQPHYQPEEVIGLIEQYRINHLYPGFPQLSLNVVDDPRFTPERFHYVRSLLNVGPEAMQQHIQSRLPPDAVLLNLFGMTEGSGIVTFTPFDAPFAVRAVSSGIAPELREVRIADPETGAILPTGETGEIQFRGPNAFKSYYNDPAATRATILEGGWVRTGDRGRLDADGYLTFAGRLKDMMKVGGENVAAAEVEAFIQKMPGVKLVQVIGVPDARLGEVPYAFVERTTDDDGAALDEDAVIAFCQGALAKWKVPRGVSFLTEWPMSATKIQKFKLPPFLPEQWRAKAEPING